MRAGWRVGIVLAVACSAVALTGCASSAKHSARSVAAATASVSTRSAEGSVQTPNAPSSASALSGSPSTAASTVASRETLTGFGATEANWDAHHQHDLDPKLVPGCCYGPRIDTVDQAGSDTWVGVQTDAVVYLYNRNFPKHTTRSEALAALVRDDLPPDAHMVASKLGSGCELFLYRSAMLAVQAPDLGSYISFDLHSGGDETVYDRSEVTGADLSASSGLGDC
jgi:hypothetical protein